MRYKIKLLFILGLAFANCRSNDISDGAKDELPALSQKIDSIAFKFLSQDKTVGFSIAILQNKDTLYNSAFGYTDTLRSQQTTPSTIFNLASISKLLGSIMVMKLVEEGKLSLDQSLVELLPDFPNTDQAKKIKLRHLISMTSGLKEYAPEMDSVYRTTGRPPTLTDLLAFFSRQRLDFEPGQFYKYSNSGFVLLPAILERATNISFEDLIDSILNKPTGLRIKLLSESQFDPNTSQHFEIQNGELAFRPFWSWIRGDGGLSASAIELAQIPFLLKDGTIINDTSFGQMIAPTKLKDDLLSGYGLGVKHGNFEGSRFWGHSGADKSFWSMMFFFPERDLTIVTLVNTNNTPYDAKELFTRVALATLNKETPNYKGSESENLDRQAYLGKYLRPGDTVDRIMKIVFNEKDNHLYYTYDGKVENGQKMYYLGNDEFWIEKWPTDRVKFARNSKEKVVALKEYYTGYFSQMRMKIE